VVIHWLYVSFSLAKWQGMQVLQAQTLDLKEYTDTQIDRSGAPAILNYGARKKSAEGHGM
jgi:hypothetical protein